MRSRFARRVAQAAFAVAVLMVGEATSAVAAPDTATFAIPGTITLAIAPIVFAQEAGFFADENIKLDTVVLHGSGEIIPQLVKGAVLTSMLTPDILISSRQPGRPNFPVHFVYNIFRRSIWQMVVLDGSPIQTLHDLGGKTVGVGALTFANVLQTKALLRRNGVDPGSVNFVAVGSGGPALETLRRGRIDALNLFEAAHARLEAQGTKIRRLQYPPEFAEISSHGLAFADKTIAERPDLVARFGRAVAKATVGCQANPENCLDAYWKVFPDQKPPESDQGGKARETHLLQLFIDSMVAFPAGAPKLYGAYSDKDWIVPIESLRDGGELPNADMDLTSLYTNKFVPDFNRFDPDAAIAKAQAYRP